MSDPEVASLRRTARGLREQRNLSAAMELERIADEREAAAKARDDAEKR